MNGNKETNKYFSGIISAVVAFVMWGLLPLYWKMLKHISPVEVLAHRILWSFVCMFILILLQRQWQDIKMAVLNKSVMKRSILSGIAVTFNWGIYIWAVNSGRVVEASLGYYITPLFMVFLGTFLFKEKLGSLQRVALVLALTGVLILTFQFGKVPWVAFILTVTFSLYGVVKKYSKVSPLIGLVLETAVMTPLAILYIVFFRLSGTEGIVSINFQTGLLFIGSGLVTSIPLLLFGLSTQRIAFSTVGFIQYIAPTLSLLLGIFVFREKFTGTHLLSYSFIWCALIIYSFSIYRTYKISRPVNAVIVVSEQ